jgi:hypothetical protein
METLKARRTGSEVFQALNANNFYPKILPSKAIIQNRWINKSLHDKQKLKEYMTTKPQLQKILQGILYTENESKQNHERTGSTKPQERKQQESRE